MKPYILFLLLPLCAVRAGAQDCARDSQACSGKAALPSPFLDASAAESLPASPAPQKPAIAPRPAEQAVVQASSSPATAPAAAADEPAGAGSMSSPLWLLFVAVVLAGLYAYLGAGRRGRRR